ncbi:OLC1v1012688C1 [Oldenlandia corymbosa var. corymbosa]|uniref:OLC1v1012688C1 n=1 Tax=Oldenlandia corymbosa var. corymbosa TaxID=529605 RepID=A0AAV1DWH3_OLDCO|nr:OLC1v1012688C1 [Oldenlandia corymbosa var. corymbosa]
MIGLITFIKENFHKLEEESFEHMPIGFEKACPSLIEMARKMNIDIPYDAPIIQEIHNRRNIKLKRRSSLDKTLTPLVLNRNGEDMNELVLSKRKGSQAAKSEDTTRKRAYALTTCVVYTHVTIRNLNSSAATLDTFIHLLEIVQLRLIDTKKHGCLQISAGSINLMHSEAADDSAIDSRFAQLSAENGLSLKLHRSLELSRSPLKKIICWKYRSILLAAFKLPARLLNVSSLRDEDSIIQLLDLDAKIIGHKSYISNLRLFSHCLLEIFDHARILPLVTSLALYFSTSPLAFFFALNTHFTPIRVSTSRSLLPLHLLKEVVAFTTFNILIPGSFFIKLYISTHNSFPTKTCFSLRSSSLDRFWLDSSLDIDLHATNHIENGSILPFRNSILLWGVRSYLKALIFKPFSFSTTVLNVLKDEAPELLMLLLLEKHSSNASQITFSSHQNLNDHTSFLMLNVQQEHSIACHWHNDVLNHLQTSLMWLLAAESRYHVFLSSLSSCLAIKRVRRNYFFLWNLDETIPLRHQIITPPVELKLSIVYDLISFYTGSSIHVDEIKWELIPITYFYDLLSCNCVKKVLKRLSKIMKKKLNHSGLLDFDNHHLEKSNYIALKVSIYASGIVCSKALEFDLISTDLAQVVHDNKNQYHRFHKAINQSIYRLLLNRLYSVMGVLCNISQSDFDPSLVKSMVAKFSKFQFVSSATRLTITTAIIARSYKQCHLRYKSNQADPKIVSPKLFQDWHLSKELRKKYENFYFSATRNQWISYNITTDSRPIKRALIYFPRNSHIFSPDSDLEGAFLMLHHLNVPLEAAQEMFPQIKEFALNLASQPHYRAPSLMSIHVEISKWTNVDVTSEIFGQGFDEDSSFEDEIMLSEMANLSFDDVNPVGVRPATREAIEDLVRNDTINILEENEFQPCVICLEVFAIGTAAIRMPCDHIFHTECICRWLIISNKCPICRFEMQAVEP